VDEGSMICCVVIDEEAGADNVILAINMGNLASAAGIAEKETIDEEPGYRWNALTDGPVTVHFSMKQPAGYLNEFLLRHLVRTNVRTDYAHLSDEQFANVRVVSTSGMGEKVLYRSSSPINPELGRSNYADAALKEAGVHTIVNLADSTSVMQAYEGFGASSYAGCSVIGLNLAIDFTEASFRDGLAKGLRFMAANEGPYLVHCTEGKDRAGFVSAVLECLMGASADEVVTDYMTTYLNYYGVEEGSAQYQAIAQTNIVKSLERAFDIESIFEADLAYEAETYLRDSLQMTQDEILLLKQKLSGR